MLSKKYLTDILVNQVAGIESEEQIISAGGLDAILELLMTLRSVCFPAVILEGRSFGTFQLVEGPLDTYTESIWVIGQLARGEDEEQIYQESLELAIGILARMLEDYKNESPTLNAWEFGRISYMKRAGGQNARGWEVVLTFKKNFSLLYTAPVNPEPEPKPEPEPDPDPEPGQDPEQPDTPDEPESELNDGDPD